MEKFVFKCNDPGCGDRLYRSFLFPEHVQNLVVHLHNKHGIESTQETCESYFTLEKLPEEVFEPEPLEEDGEWEYP